jgi:hypothetical protein
MPKNPATLTLEDILTQGAFYRKGMEAATDEIEEAKKEQANLAEDSADTLMYMAEDKHTIVLAEETAKLETQARIAKVAALMGTDINATNNRYTALVEKQEKAASTRSEAAATIAEKDAVGLFDNPIQHIINGFTINKDILRHNNANRSYKEASAEIETLNTQTQSTIVTQRQLAAGTTQASAIAAADLAAGEFTFKANQAKIAGFQYNVEGIEAAAKTGKDVYDNMYSGLTAIKVEQGMRIQAAQLSISQAHLQETLKNGALQRTLTNMTIDEHKDAQAAGETLIKSINLGRAARGAEPLDDANMKTALLYFKTGRGAANDVMQNDLITGQLSEMSGKAVISTSPTGFATLRAKNIPVNLTPAQQVVGNLIGNAVESLGNPNSSNQDQATVEARQNLAKLAGIKDPKELATAKANILNNYTAGVFVKKSNEIIPGDESNPFNIGSINALAEISPTVANLPLYQKVFAAQAKAGVQLTDPDKIFNDTVKAMVNKTITYKEALGITTMFHVGVNTNIAARNMTGIAGIAPTLSYRSKVSVGNAYGNTQIMDYTKADEVGRALMRAAQRISNNGWGDNTMPQQLLGQ